MHLDVIQWNLAGTKVSTSIHTARTRGYTGRSNLFEKLLELLNIVPSVRLLQVHLWSTHCRLQQYCPASAQSVSWLYLWSMDASSSVSRWWPMQTLFPKRKCLCYQPHAHGTVLPQICLHMLCILHCSNSSCSFMSAPMASALLQQDLLMTKRCTNSRPRTPYSMHSMVIPDRQ